MNLSYFLRHDTEEIVWHSELLYKKYLRKIYCFQATDDSIGLKVVVYGREEKIYSLIFWANFSKEGSEFWTQN